MPGSKQWSTMQFDEKVWQFFCLTPLKKWSAAINGSFWNANVTNQAKVPFILMTMEIWVIVFFWNNISVVIQRVLKFCLLIQIGKSHGEIGLVEISAVSIANVWRETNRQIHFCGVPCRLSAPPTGKLLTLESVVRFTGIILWNFLSLSVTRSPPPVKVKSSLVACSLEPFANDNS